MGNDVKEMYKVKHYSMAFFILILTLSGLIFSLHKIFVNNEGVYIPLACFLFVIICFICVSTPWVALKYSTLFKQHKRHIIYKATPHLIKVHLSPSIVGSDTLAARREFFDFIDTIKKCESCRGKTVQFRTWKITSKIKKELNNLGFVEKKCLYKGTFFLLFVWFSQLWRFETCGLVEAQCKEGFINTFKKYQEPASTLWQLYISR